MHQRLTLIYAAAAVFVAMLMMLPLALAQGITGTVTGSVKDACGALIPGASETLVSLPFETVSQDAGTVRMVSVVKRSLG